MATTGAFPGRPCACVGDRLRCPAGQPAGRSDQPARPRAPRLPGGQRRQRLRHRAARRSPSTTTTDCPRTIRPACTGTTRTTTAWSPTRSSAASTAPSWSRTPRNCRSAGSGSWSSPTSPWTAPGALQPPSTMARMMGREGELVLVNGQARPTLTARPGERERWRIVNACAARYVRLRLDGQQLDLLGIDSGPLRRATPRRGARAGHRQPGRPAGHRTEGTSTLRGAGRRPGRIGGMGWAAWRAVSGDGPLATLRVTGAPSPGCPPSRSVPQPDLRAAEPRRAGGWSSPWAWAWAWGGMGGMRFTIDGAGVRPRPRRPDRRAWARWRSGRWPTPPRWTTRSTCTCGPCRSSPKPASRWTTSAWQDVVNVPPAAGSPCGSPSTTSRGRTVYHCHILDHEDNGGPPPPLPPPPPPPPPPSPPPPPGGWPSPRPSRFSGP